MSKLSSSLKALIGAAHARPNTVPAPNHAKKLFEDVASSAKSKDVGIGAWLTIATATSMTMNSPDSLLALYKTAVDTSGSPGPVGTAEFMREVGLKCICLNGVPRVINCLGAFRAGLPENVVNDLSKEPTREPTKENIDTIASRGQQLWKSIYNPFDEKLYSKLAASHPNLPVHILHSEYGALLSDPSRASDMTSAAPSVGRVLTSLVAIACLRAQSGVGPQVTSHVFGLRKAFEDSTAEGEDEVKGGKWLAGNEGSEWILKTVDGIVEALGEGQGTTFAPGFRAKL